MEKGMRDGTLGGGMERAMNIRGIKHMNIPWEAENKGAEDNDSRTPGRMLCGTCIEPMLQKRECLGCSGENGAQVEMRTEYQGVGLNIQGQPAEAHDHTAMLLQWLLEAEWAHHSILPQQC